MRITDKDFVAVIDILSDSSGTAAVIKNYAAKGRVVIADKNSLRSIIFADGEKGPVVCFSSVTPQGVCKQINENGFIII